MYIEESDYEVQVRQEIMQLLDQAIFSCSAVSIAERMAIDQVRQYLGGRYDIDTVFSREGTERDHYLVMIVIDLALYHLWSKRAPRKIPEHRAQRYQDALDWLKAAGEGTIRTNLPQLPTDEYNGDVLIASNYKPNQNKY